MTSRERVRTVLSGGIPDKVPVDIGGTFVTGMHVNTYLALGEYLGIDLELPKVYDQYQMLARIGEEIRSWFGSDVVQIENNGTSWFSIPNRGWKPWTNTSGREVLIPGGMNPIRDEKGDYSLYNEAGEKLAVMAAQAVYFHKCYPENYFRTFDENPTDPQEWKNELPLYTDEELKNIQSRAKFWYENTDYSLFGAFERGRLSSSTAFAHYKLDEWMVLMMMEPEYAGEVLQATAERAVDNLKLYLQACGDYIDAALISPADYGTQRAPMLRTEVFDELYVPNYKMITDYLHEHSNVKAFFHSCGSINPLIPSFIKMGCDALNPVQISADNMDPHDLKTRYGKELVFWGGGLDTQSTLPNGTEEEVYEETRRNMEIFKQGGRYVFTPVQNIQADVPPRNLAAMVRAIRDSRSY